MVIVRLWEGLGNQLFQYAYARALQQRMQVPVFLDIRHDNRGDLPYEAEDIIRRKLGIQHFNISLKPVRTDKIFPLQCLDGKRVWHRLGYRMLKRNMGRWKFMGDDGAPCTLHRNLLNVKDSTYISAHCVNKEYYRQYRYILLKELQLKRDLDLSGDLNAILKDRNTVSIHVRLTDFFRNPSMICGQMYYSRAIDYIRSKVSDPYFIIFTDDYEMARHRYRFEKDFCWAGKYGYKDYEELMLMSQCRHNIMAYSTFSYWGAWLNQNPEKIVVAPARMFNGGLYEKGWKIIGR